MVSFSERGSLTENNGTITKVQLLMVMEKFNFFKNFKNFGKSKKKIFDLYELDNSKKKIFFEIKFSK